jgi:cysteine desulfurase / selenocysteine lyase
MWLCVLSLRHCLDIQEGTMDRKMFPRTTEVAYLDTAAEGLPPHPACEQAFREYCSAKAKGTPGRTEHFAAERDALELAARLLNTDATNIAFAASASDALALLASSIDWKPGDHIITTDLDFPSNVLPWLRLKSIGVTVTVVASTEGSVDWRSIVEHLSDRTRVVALSLVSYKSGAYFPFVERVAAEAHKRGAIMVVDATQALGRCTVSLAGVDYLVSSSFKWLLGAHGLGLVYICPSFRRHFAPAAIGWYSVEDAFGSNRFESYTLKSGAGCLAMGMPNFASLYVLRYSLRFLLDRGIDSIFRELQQPVRQLRSGLSELQLSLLTPPQSEFASGIVSFSHPRADELGTALAKAGVIVWAGDGRVRASIHVYNDGRDVEQYLHALKIALNHL